MGAFTPYKGRVRRSGVHVGPMPAPIREGFITALGRHQSRASGSNTMSGHRPVRVCLHHYHGGARSKDKRVRMKSLLARSAAPSLHDAG